MKDKKDRNISGLDIMRILCTAAVFVYHFDRGLLQGGYIAVSVFLVMYGYLFAVSASAKEKFSAIGYLLKRVLRLYLPLVIVTCISVYALRYAPQVIWLNEKPETMSVLEACNNWWQISAGESYFARVTDSPFTHMWYISMLIQIEIVLPFIYKFISLIRKKIPFFAWWIPLLLITALSVCVMPYLGHHGASQMRLYFGTDARLFSVLAGSCLGFLHSEDKRIIPKALKGKWLGSVLFLALLAALGWMCLNIGETHELYRYGFCASTILALFLIAVCSDKESGLFGLLRNPVTGPVASISYEVYLTHYPMLFFFKTLTGMTERDIWIYIAAVIAVSALLHFGVSLRFKKEWKVWAVNTARVVLLIPFIFFAVHGAEDIYLAKDHTAEMQELQQQLAESGELLGEIQNEYMMRRQQENDILNDPEAMARISEAWQLPVTCIGDSVMLGAVRSLRETFPNGDFDAQENRSHYPLYSIVRERSANGTLGNPVIIGIGTNNVLPKDTCEEIIRMCGEREIYWLTITNDWQFPNNNMIRQLGEEFDNVTVVDWAEYSKDHDNWFYYDGIHLTPDGRKAYAEYILECISRNFVMRKLEEEKANRTLFIGDGYVYEAADLIGGLSPDLYLIASEEPDADAYIKEIEELKSNDALPERVFISVGSESGIAEEDIVRLFDALEGCDITVIKVIPYYENGTGGHLDKIAAERENIRIAEWNCGYYEYPDRFTPDRVHLSAEGAKAFSAFVSEVMKEDAAPPASKQGE